METRRYGKVTLVGAGCGSWDLLTLRALRVLRTADVIVYDDLIDDEALKLAKADAEFVYVGKRSGRHSMKQEAINEVLIDLAKQGKQVCRLKGGDPYVFGRGGEEVLALQAEGIDCEEIPGISSAIAIPAAAGIPVTHRRVSRSFHVVTAHSADSEDGLPEDLPKLASLHGTLVFLMGLSKLRPLSEALIRYGMPETMPAAVLGKESYRGTLANIAEIAKDATAPAIILVGQTAAMELCKAAEAAPVVVGLTGTEHFSMRMKEALSECGLATRTVQRSEIQSLCDAESLRAALQRKPNVIALTSPNGVNVFFGALYDAEMDARDLSGIRFAVVGAGTAEALRRHGIRADLMPESHDTDALAVLLAESCAGCRVLLAGAEERSQAPARALEEAGISFEELTLYRLKADLSVCAEECDYIVFGSASAVVNYFAAGGSMPRKTVCIGWATAKKAETYACKNLLVAKDATPKALTEEILKDLSR